MGEAAGRCARPGNWRAAARRLARGYRELLGESGGRERGGGASVGCAASCRSTASLPGRPTSCTRNERPAGVSSSGTATAVADWVARTTLIGRLASTVRWGSVAAVVGAMVFSGRRMAYMARWVVGADHRWSLPVTLLATPALLLFADVLGRLLVPGELRVSVVSAFIGAPVLIFLVRRKRGGGL